MKDTNISFIGGGNMAGSLIGGLIGGGAGPANIWVSDPDREQTARLVERYGIHGSDNNEQVAARGGVVVFAVKPQILPNVARELAPIITSKQPLVISIAAGVREPDLARWLGLNTAIVRAMPNTPALVQSGATVLYANARVTAAQRDRAESIMRAVGLTLWLDDETLMDAVTALSGSGPAYFFLVMEVLEQAGVKLGLPRDTARLLVLQTAFGAAKMALESPDRVEILRNYVTSPGGTTESAINCLQDGKLQELFERALSAAHTRAIELANQLGGT